jgi:hypothetical protein
MKLPGGEETADVSNPRERRACARRRVLKAATVAFNDHHSTLPCMLREISEGGVRLRVEGPWTAPDHFELTVELDGLDAQCEVVWRQGREIGAKFLLPPHHVAPKRMQVVTPITPNAPPSLRRKPARNGE